MGRNGILKKHKLKINILDLVIFVVILCVVAVIIFRDTISEFFGAPQDITVKCSVTVMEVPFDESLLFGTGNNLKITASGHSVEAAISGRNTVNSEKKDCYDITVTVISDGYKKFGSFYTESGMKLSNGNRYEISIGDKTYAGYCVNVEKDAK